MGLVHTYSMNAKDGKGDTLATALGELRVAIARLKGAQGTQLLRDRAEHLRFSFVEFWVDEESRKAANANLPEELMGRIMSALAGKPTTASYDQL